MAAASALKMTYEELAGEETTIEQKEIPSTKKVDGMERAGFSCAMACAIYSRNIAHEVEIMEHACEK